MQIKTYFEKKPVRKRRAFFFAKETGRPVPAVTDRPDYLQTTCPLQSSWKNRDRRKAFSQDVGKRRAYPVKKTAKPTSK